MVSGVKKSNNDLQKNAVVVLDEFHYMGQPGRGGKLRLMARKILYDSL